MKHFSILLLSTVYSFNLSGCNTSDEPSQQSNQPQVNSFVISSPAMSEGSALPITYTCDGESISPPFSWSGAPQATQSYALVMDHHAPDGIHWYWTMYNIEANNTQVQSGEVLGQLGTNSVNHLNEYAPPCSKGPGEKIYTYTVYALSESVTLNKQTEVDRTTLLAAIKDITLASATMNVSYERSTNNMSRFKEDRRPAKPEFTQPDLSVDIDSAKCDIIKGSVSDAGFEKSVSVVCDENYAYVVSSTYPKHELMTGIRGTNEQIPVPAENYAAPIKLHPKKANALTTIDAAVGVAVNGVPIYDYSSQGELDVNNYDAKHDTLVLGQLDNCGGHAGRGDDYHYHVSPTCMIDVMKNKESDAIIGWAYDGYPLYGNKNPDGSDIKEGQLDVCNGQTDETFGYRYQTSTIPPYIIQCLVGEVDTKKLPRVSPLSGDIEKIRADLRPPKEGVENLTHTIAADGSRTMTYSYRGTAYFTTYSPSKQGDSCYDFKQKTISNNGKVETGTFCRTPQNQDGKLLNASKPSKPRKANNTKPVVTKQSTDFEGKHNFTLEAWADNWFSAYIGETLLIEDSVSITTERSFNAERVNFSTDYPIQLNLIIKDFKQNDSGLEYIGARNQQMGDGGFILQVTDNDINQVVAASDSRWKCEVLHKAPLNKLCESEADPVAGQGYCTFMSKDAPDNWLADNFDDSTWDNATEHKYASVSPKDGYNEINWHKKAQLIWGEDLETDNTLICRVSIEQPQKQGE